MQSRRNLGALVPQGGLVASPPRSRIGLDPCWDAEFASPRDEAGEEDLAIPAHMHSQILSSHAAVSLLLVSTNYEEQMARMRLMDTERLARVGLFSYPGMSVDRSDSGRPFFDPLRHAPKLVVGQVREVLDYAGSWEKLMVLREETRSPKCSARGDERCAVLEELCRDFQSVVRDQQRTIRALEDENLAMRGARGQEFPDLSALQEASSMAAQHLRRGEDAALQLVSSTAITYALLPQSTHPNSELEISASNVKVTAALVHKHILATQDALLVLSAALADVSITGRGVARAD